MLAFDAVWVAVGCTLGLWCLLIVVFVCVL